MYVRNNINLLTRGSTFVEWPIVQRTRDKFQQIHFKNRVFAFFVFFDFDADFEPDFGVDFEPDSEADFDLAFSGNCRF